MSPMSLQRSFSAMGWLAAAPLRSIAGNAVCHAIPKRCYATRAKTASTASSPAVMSATIPTAKKATTTGKKNASTTATAAATKKAAAPAKSRTASAAATATPTVRAPKTVKKATISSAPAAKTESTVLPKKTAAVSSATTTLSAKTSSPRPTPATIAAETAQPRATVRPLAPISPPPAPLQAAQEAPKGPHPTSREYRKAYNRAARKWVATMVAMPILLVTSYYLFDRLALGNEAKILPDLDPETGRADAKHRLA